jgi:hypothetical protein
MARLGNKKIFSGMAGNVVFRNLNGRQIAQSRPANVKHSASQKNAAAEFGNCSRWTKQIRLGLAPLLLGMTDTPMYQRFTAALHTAIKNSGLPQGERTPLTAGMQSLSGFEFNSHSPFAEYFKNQLTAYLNEDNEVVVTLPAFDAKDAIVFPAYCSNVKLIAYAYATDFKDNPTQLAFHNVIEISQDETLSAQTLLHTTPIPAGHFVLVTAKLLFHNPNPLTETNYLNTKELSPSMIVMAGATGE